MAKTPGRRLIRAVYDSTCPRCIQAVELVRYREATLQGPPTIEVLAWPSPEADALLRALPQGGDVISLARGHMVAQLTTGLVLPRCEDDVMRLIYEMEYLAFVQAPEPLRTALLAERYVAPLASARSAWLAGAGAGAGAEAEARAEVDGADWWAAPRVHRLSARSLRDVGFCILDDFLPEKLAAELLHGAQDARRRREMVRGATGAAGKILSDEGYSRRLEQQLNEPSRGDVVKFAEDANMPGCEGLHQALDRFVVALKACDDVAERLRFVDFANPAMFAIYPGDASRYVKHVDNTLGTDGRRLTAIIYLNRDWKPEDGGRLRIFEPTMASVQAKADVDPLWNRLLLFWSTKEVPHEVLSSYRDRTAVSIWYICGRESLGNQEAFQRLLSGKRSRVVSKRRLTDAVRLCAESDEQRNTLEAMPIGESALSDYVRKNADELGKCFHWRTDEQLERENESEQDRRIRASLAGVLEQGRDPAQAFGCFALTPNFPPRASTATLAEASGAESGEAPAMAFGMASALAPGLTPAVAPGVASGVAFGVAPRMKPWAPTPEPKLVESCSLAASAMLLGPLPTYYEIVD